MNVIELQVLQAGQVFGWLVTTGYDCPFNLLYLLFDLLAFMF
jgi:hypothetical protein